MDKGQKKEYSGMTIIEMMVAISIFTIAILGFTMLFMRSWKMNSYTIEMGQSSYAVSQGVNNMVSYLRKVRQADDGSYPIKSAAENDLVVFSDYDKDGVTERLHFYLQGGQIIMGITKPTTGIPKTYESSDQQIKVLAERIVNTADEPIFYYYNKDYPGDTANNPVAMPVDVSTIRLVRIFLKINIDPNRAPDNIETQSFVELRNLNDYDRMK
ncbi:MAG: prepilin-type N-terminal cleavage/methylation domain-containing protein [Candidatus Moranbacteria bacterium]|nr:prepilin-type N-terminal cleavage/methylation domain-containing protein [Candidatus Moranbacteria bacterium]